MRPFDSDTKMTYSSKFAENLQFMDDPSELYEKVARLAMRQKIDRNLSNVDRAIIGF